MVDGSATTADNAGSPWPGSRVRPQAVRELEVLLALLFPDTPLADCITVDDVLRLYRFSGLSVATLRAIEQSQRIVRARGDYAMLGVCEFHIGLIYFTWSDPRAAANQFLLARQSWTLAGDHPGKCLGHFAQGLALAEALHYEPAMLQYGRAERLLSQPPRHGPAATRHGALEEALRPLLLAAQAAARARLWPYEGSDPAAAGSADGANQTTGGATPPPRGATPPPRAEAAASDDAAPIDNLLRSGVVSNLRGAQARRESPIPGHTFLDGRYAWYAVADRRGDFLSSIAAGIWLLADNELDDAVNGRVLVIVGSRQAGLGSISLRPFGPSTVTQSLYLGFRDSGVGGGRPIASAQLFLNSGDSVSGSDVQVLGVVRGFWQALDGQALAVSP